VYFLPLRSYLERPDHLCEVRKSAMLVSVSETDERYGWTVHLPPIIWRQYQPGDCEPDIHPDDLFLAIFDSVHPFAAHDRLFWLECYAVRYHDGRVDATCRYNNNKDWPQGQRALLIWASGWPDAIGRALSKRQFLMFEPTAIDKLPSTDVLTQRMNEETAKGGEPSGQC
jgi:hypothetical protein